MSAGLLIARLMLGLALGMPVIGWT